MTDRVNSLTVVLDRDMRTDDVESTIAAILHIKGVINVEGNVTDHSYFVAETRAKRKFTEMLYEVIEKINK